MKKIYSLIIFGFALLQSHAQTGVLAQEFAINPYTISPSNSGLTGNHEIFVGGFYNMAGLAGSPVNIGVNYNGILKGNSGIGAKLNFEKYGAFRNINIDLSYAYHLKFASVHRLSVGLAVQLHQNTIDFSNSNSDPLNDPAIADAGVKSGFVLNASVGLTYSFNKFILSVAVNNLIPTKRNSKMVLYSQNQSIRFYLAYNFALGRIWSVKPQVLVEQTLNEKLNYCGLISVRYKNRVWLNLSYSAPNCIGAGIGASFTERFVLQYTFRYAMGGIVKTTAGNHELCLGIALGKLNSNSSSNSIFRQQSKSPYYEWE